MFYRKRGWCAARRDHAEQRLRRRAEERHSAGTRTVVSMARRKKSESDDAFNASIGKRVRAL